MFEQKFARSNDITGAGARIAMNANQSIHELRMRAFEKKRSDGFDRTKPHLCRTAACKKAENHFFPKPLVRSKFPNNLKFGESRANFLTSFGVCRLYSFNG